jgi:hypothetical protein
MNSIKPSVAKSGVFEEANEHNLLIIAATDSLTVPRIILLTFIHRTE